MALDLKKPLIHRKSGEAVRFLGELKRPFGALVVAFTYKADHHGLKGTEYVVCLNADELANPPKSRWLNVYATNENGAYPRWTSSRYESDEVAADGRIAVIEDKQDGSDWIIHKVGS